MKKRALVSVSDKEDIIPFVTFLIENNIEVISTGGTCELLKNNGLDVINISDITGFPEIMDGRVKTLHPKVHGGLLAVRNNEQHMKEAEELNILPIDIVVVNLYPFKETISKSDVKFNDAIENIDVGGPTMIRAAAKNHEFVTVIVDPKDYTIVMEEIKNEGITISTNRYLAAKAFRHTASYDTIIGNYLTEYIGEENPEILNITYEKKQSLRYGENPHQKAAFYQDITKKESSITFAKKLHGKEMSYNNINDGDIAISMLKEFSEPTVVVIKHMNPCGVGTGEAIEEAYHNAYNADPISIFGGIVALNRNVDKDIAEKLSEIFLEIVIAPSFSQEALSILTKKKNIRLLEVPIKQNDKVEKYLTTVSGGLLVQEKDIFTLENAEITIPTKRTPSDKEWEDLKLAWKVVKHVKSNAIVIAKDNMTIGIGAGQMNRVGAAKIALNQAGETAINSSMASDAFFPMADTVDEAIKKGVTAIIQPGGSIRDEESIALADKHNIAMVLTGIRHFKH